MPRKGHTCCVLGCTVNSKKTELADGRRPRFFCFPHEKKRPHLRRAWLALTRRTEASTNTRVCEFHFVDGKPSNVNPHPILNMGMEPTKMQKRAMELRQQKELRKMLMQQQLAAGGGQLMGQVLPGGAIVVDGQIVGQDSLGVGTSFGQQLMGDGNQDQGSDGSFQLDSPNYLDHITMGAAVGEQEDGLPSQIAYQNPMSLVVHDRKNIDEMDDSMGSLAQELLNTTPDTEGDDNSKDQPVALSDQPEITQPTEEDLDALPEECSNIMPLNGPENPTSTSNDVTGSSSCPTSIPVIKSEEDMEPTPAIVAIKSEEDMEPTPATSATPATTVTDTEQSFDTKSQTNGDGSSVPNSLQGTSSNSHQENGHIPELENKSSFPIFNNQISNKSSTLPIFKNQIPMPIQTSTPLKVPSWHGQQNGISSAGAPVAKKPRKRKSTPHMISNMNKSVTIPRIMNAIPVQAPKSVNQPKMVMSINSIEKLKSDILENLRAEFLTELQQESESNKQLKIEMETVRMQTRQELQQMRVELHALWGENQRLTAQVEGLLQERESSAHYNGSNIYVENQ